MDPNLLPQNLRSREVKEIERSKKLPRGFVVDMHKPQKEKAGFDLANSDRPKLSWWKKVFGSSVASGNTVPVLTDPMIDKGQYNNMNWLANDSKHELPKIKQKQEQKTKYKTYKQPKVKAVSSDGWLKKLLGKPISPILPPEEIRNIELKESVKEVIKIPEVKVVPPEVKKPVLVAEPKSQPQTTVFIKTNKYEPKTSDSWLAILKGLLGFSNVKDRKVNFVSSGLVVPQPVTAIKPKPIEQKHHQEKENYQIKEVPKKTIKPSYNLVPKRQKTEINVNLIPQELKLSTQFGTVINFKLLLLAIILPILLITGTYFAIVYASRNLEKTMAVNRNELTGLTQQIGDFVVKEKQNNSVAQKVTTIKKLLDEKYLWSKFFTLLEKYTLDGVYFTNLSADTSGILVLPGVADNYSVLAQQLAVFRDASDFVREVKIPNAQLYSETKAGVVGSSFQINLTLQDTVFKKTK